MEPLAAALLFRSMPPLEERMAAEDGRRILVLGVGNILMSDDGIGVWTVQEFQRGYSLPPHVQVVDGGTCGMELLDHIAGCTDVIILDCVRAGAGGGELVRLAGEQVPAFFQMKVSPHHIGISDVLAALILTGEKPENVVVLGVEAVSLEESMEMSPQVAARQPELLGRLLAELESLGVTAQPNAPAC